MTVGNEKKRIYYTPDSALIYFSGSSTSCFVMKSQQMLMIDS